MNHDLPVSDMEKKKPLMTEKKETVREQTNKTGETRSVKTTA